MRKLRYFIACTVDRFIARPDGSYEFFLTEGEQVADLHAAFSETIPACFREKLGITSENQCFDAVVIRHVNGKCWTFPVKNERN